LTPLFSENLSPILVVFAYLYGFLALSSAWVWRLDCRASLRLQIFAWWRIFPIVTLAVMFFPLGIGALFYFLTGLVWRELRVYPAEPKHFTSFCGFTLVGYSLILLLPQSVQLPVQSIGFALAIFAYRILISYRQIATACWLLALTGLGFLLTVPHWITDTAFTAAAKGYELANLQLVVLLFVLTALNDVAQFISGKLFGKHYLAATLSPNKTWQGALGGVVVTLCLALLIGNYWQLASSASLLLLGITLAIAGIIGDLCLSYAKRQLSIKDFSQLIPGHGGILDRVDSLIFTTPVMVLWAQFVFGVV